MATAIEWCIIERVRLPQHNDGSWNNIYHTNLPAFASDVPAEHAHRTVPYCLPDIDGVATIPGHDVNKLSGGGLTI